eukprot:SAG31_NODE_457_length_15415_cov_4.380387_12_plen_92_part_00
MMHELDSAELPLLTEEQWWAFDTLGFLHLQAVLSPSDLRRDKSECALFEQPVISAYARQLCGPQAKIDPDSICSLQSNPAVRHENVFTRSS